jgi:hypothetical protein
MTASNVMLPVTSPWEKMLAAVVSGSSAMLGALLDSGISPDIVPSPTDVGLLTRALQSQFNQGALMLIEAGATATARAPGLTPPIYAAAQGDDAVEMCEALLKAGALIDQCAAGGQTALLRSALNMQLDLCQLLLQHGANPTIVSNYGATPLRLAASSSDHRAVPMMRMLIAAGADPSYLPKRQHRLDETMLTPFQAAVSNNVAENVAYFLHECGADPSQIAEDGRTMLELTSSPEVQELLLSALAEQACAIPTESADGPDFSAQRPSKSMSPI